MFDLARPSTGGGNPPGNGEKVRNTKMIWLLTEGWYSDYHVLAAFSTEEGAQKALAKGFGDAVEPCKFDPVIIAPPEGMSYRHVHMKRDGTVLKCSNDGGRGEAWHVSAHYDDCRLRSTEITFLPGSDSFRVSCWASDECHAVKIANEQRAIAIAKWQEVAVIVDGKNAGTVLVPPGSGSETIRSFAWQFIYDKWLKTHHVVKAEVTPSRVNFTLQSNIKVVLRDPHGEERPVPETWPVPQTWPQLS